ncbi:hypothetical protein EV643_12824 [Kribbella sp. VKM Ac-2527]|uniref:Uncharacterized protein n=1 Tax=Kribbella caucasensis TaxID=2512215 RepID=A0A4R6JEG4_9ACTN|nr:hypothetical protein [Kribbella sp. VKM Ac-2527]TDO34239.1 hypothetical protein EV643_12824 [Kribbella sp. VKM Ac-2527]
MKRVEWIAAATGISGLGLPLLLAAGLPQPLRAVVAFALIGFVPGFAVTRLLGFGDNVMLVVVSIALSLSLTAAVSTLLLSLTAWSWLRCVYVLGAITLVASAVRLGRPA